MAKNTDQFEKFKAATLGESPKLSDAISRKIEIQEPLPASPRDSQAKKPSKNDNTVSVCFNLDKEFKVKLNHLKADMNASFNDLYNEAVELLLSKYKKL